MTFAPKRSRRTVITMRGLNSKTPLLVTEILFALAFFMLFSVFCVKAFVGASLRSEKTELLYDASSAASDTAECFHAAKADTGKPAALL